MKFWAKIALPAWELTIIRENWPDCSPLFLFFLDDLVPGDILLDGFILGEEELRPAVRAVFVLFVDDGAAIRTSFECHGYILLYPNAICQVSLTSLLL